MNYTQLLRIILVFFCKIIPSAGLFIVYMVFSRYLPKNDYGIYQSVWVLLGLTTVLSGFGLPTFFLSFFSKLSKESLFQFLKKGAIIGLIVSFISALLIYQYYKGFTFYSILLFSVLSFSQAFYLIQEPLMVSAHKEKLLLWSNTIYALLFVVAHLSIVFIEYNLDYLLLVFLILSILRNLFFLKEVNTRIEFEKNDKINKDSLYSEWYFLGFNDSIQVAGKWLDKIIASLLLLPSDFAVYFNGSIELPLFLIFTSAVNLVVTNLMSENSESKQFSPIEIFRITTSWMACLIFPMFWLLWIGRNEFIELFFGSKYHDSVQFFVYSALIIPCRIGNYSGLLQIQQKSRYVVYGTLLDLIVSILLGYLFYLTIGIGGMILGVVITTYFQSIFYLHIASKDFGVSWMYTINLPHLIKKFIFAGCIISFIYYFSPFLFSNKWVIFGLTTLGAGIVSCVLLYRTWKSKIIF